MNYIERSKTQATKHVSQHVQLLKQEKKLLGTIILIRVAIIIIIVIIVIIRITIIATITIIVIIIIIIMKIVTVVARTHQPADQWGRAS